MAERQLPYGAFNFLVEISDVTAGGFSDVSGLTTEIKVAEYRTGADKTNHTRKVAGSFSSSEVTCKRGIINSADLWKWVNAVRQSGISEKKTAVITLLSETGDRVQGWKLHGVLPVKLNGPTLAAKGGGDVAMEELVLSVDDLEFLE